jgi:mono/diheme cytochrome c family protein
MQRIKYLPAFCIFFFCCCSSGNKKNAMSLPQVTVPNPSADVNTSRGQELFHQRCIACHGLSGERRNNNAADLSLSVLDSISIVNTIINGKGPMPMFDHSMPDSDLAQLELYVKTLRK